MSDIKRLRPALYDHWNGTTQYAGGQLRRYTNTGNTDANGRVVFQLTQTGVSGGTALFTSLLSASALAVQPSTTATQGVFFQIESYTATTVTVRGLTGTVTGILIGGTVNSLAFVGAGIQCILTVDGVRA